MTSVILDPLGPLALAPKYQKLLASGKFEGLRLTFNGSGFIAQAKLEGGDFMPLTEAMASLSSKDGKVEDFSSEKAHAVGKYEKRLDEEAPAAFRAASSMEDIRAAIAALEFRKRNAYNLSNKEFEMKYLRWEGGNPVLRSAEQAEALRMERAATRGGGARGRGRGGRGRGSFRGPQGQAATPQQAPQGA